MDLDFVKEMTDTDLNKLVSAVLDEQKERQDKRATAAFEQFIAAFRGCVDAGIKIKYCEDEDDVFFTLYEDGFYYDY